MRPADFTLRYEWRAGTMPPPHHYYYTIQIGPAQSGEIQFCPDYAVNEPPVWVEKFKVTKEGVDALYQALDAREIMGREWPEPEEQTIGGSLQRLEFSAHGDHFSVPPRLTSADTAVMADLYQLIRALVPADVWARLNSRHEAYKQGQ